MITASNSSHSTPRSAPSDHAPLPSFVVTSSNDAPFANAATPVKTSTSTVVLNPDAREFRLPSSFAGALFAMPRQQQRQRQRWGPSNLVDFPSRPSGSPHGSPAPAQTSTGAALAMETLDSAHLVELTETYMHEVYDRKCCEDGLHMVSVFHLHPRTTNKQLSSMFFPTGACAAEVLDPRLMPEPLASTFNVIRQRAGAVFFTRKDFAMVGVEKIHDFVPHGQHQPLVVRYCGPYTQDSTPQSSEGMTSVSNNTNKKFDAVTAPKTASPPSARQMPPQTNFRDPHSSRNTFLSNALEAAAAASTNTPMNTYDVIDQHFLQKYAGEKVFLVGVHNLAYGTSAKSFYKMFYPMGALNSELLPRPVSVDGKLRCSGVAIFGSKGMAMEAAEKINNFVPHGQRRPVVARFLDRTQVPLLDVSASGVNKNTIVMDGRELQQSQPLHGTPLATASTPRANAPNNTSGLTPVATNAASTVTSASSSVAALLFAIERQLQAKTISDAQLAADMCALVLCSDSTECEAKALADILRDALLSKGDHSTILSSPLSGAFRTMHSTLGIRLRTAPASPADNTAAAKKGVMFLQLMGRMLMMLVADTAAARQTRIVAAVQCAYLYQYPYLPKTPLCFATVLFQQFSVELTAAKAFLCREAEVPSSIEEERQHRPWMTLIDALSEMVQVWRSLDPRQYAQDAARDEYERFVCYFRGVTMNSANNNATEGDLCSPVRVQQGHEEAGAEACTPRNDTLEVNVDGAHTGSGSGNGATSSAKKSQLVTPSARPTPRRVVSKSYSTSTSDWKGKQSTPVNAGNGAIPPQVMLSSPASDYTQGASEFSVESSTAGPFNSALRSLGLSPQHPSMRFAWSLRVAGTTQASPAPPPATVCTVPAQTISPTSTATAERSDAAMAECTVYITKLPSCFTSGQVRRLLLHFGDFRKVRLCHDDKETMRSGTAEAVAAHQLKFHELCFGFVEFVEPTSARAMVEFFRNEVHNSTAFDFLRNSGEAHDAFDENELKMLHNTRTSQARNPIHDQQPVDATRTTPCFFGLIRPEHTIDTYAEAVTADDVAAAVKAMETVQEPAQPSAVTPAATAVAATTMMPFATAGVFSTATPFNVLSSTAAATTATTPPRSAVGPFSVTGLQSMEDVHFPQSFPYNHIFAGACDDDLDDRNNNGVNDAPVLVEDDDDDGLQEYQVQEILKLLN